MTTSTRHRAFSLIELLFAIGIIAILAALTLGLGPRLVESRREAAAEQLLATLDRALEEYTVSARRSTDRGDDAHIGIWANVPDSAETEEIRILFGDSPEAQYEGFLVRPDAAIFVQQARGVGAVDDIIAGLPERFVTRIYARPSGGAGGGPGGPGNPGLPGGSPGSGEAQALTSILDPWGNRVLFVHPDNIVAQRLYGRCLNNRPYFLSAGPDGRYGLVADADEAARAAAEITTEGLPGLIRRSLEDNLTSYPVGPADLSDEFFNEVRDR